MKKRAGFRPATEEERRALGVPPAYVDVLVAEDPRAELIAVATTPKGKTFYKYSKDAVARTSREKWKRVGKLAQKMEKVEARISRDCERGVPEAMTARLVLLTGMRNGNPPQGDKPSFGASSLLLKHVQKDGERLIFDFPGKHGVMQHYELVDPVLAEYVVRRRMEAGVDGDIDETRLFLHSAGDTLRYLKKVGAQKVHDLRTWRANVIAGLLIDEILKMGTPSTAKERKAIVRMIGEKVGAVLGNKPGQALKSYIDPSVLRRLDPSGEE